MRIRVLASSLGLLIAACSGGGDETAVSAGPATEQSAPGTSGGTSVPSAPAAPSSGSPAASPPASSGSTPPSQPPAAGTEPGSQQSPVVLAGGYATTEHTCMQGTPLFWARRWTINYNGGVLRFTPLIAPLTVGSSQPEPEQILIWQTSNLVTQQHQDAATFSAPTTDGRQAWLTIHRDGSVIGAGYHGTTSSSYLRCGNPTQDAPIEPPKTFQMQCKIGNSPGLNGTVVVGATYQTSFEIDRSTFPFTTLKQGDPGPNRPFRTDPTGELIADPRSHIVWHLPETGDGNVRVYIGGTFGWEGTFYQFRDGELTLVERANRVQQADICRPVPQ